MTNFGMRAVLRLCGLLVLLLLAGVARADTFHLVDGQTVTGDIVALDERGIIVKQADGTYTDPIGWPKFSQPDLRAFMSNPKAARFAEPFIELTHEDRVRRSEIRVADVAHFPHPGHRSLIGAMFSSPVGLVLLLIIYAANLYAAFEIALFTGRPVNMVCGVSAIAPLLGPALFLYLPAPQRTSGAKSAQEQEWRPEEEYRNAPAPAPVTASAPAPAAAPDQRPPAPSRPRAPITPPPPPAEPEVPVETYHEPAKPSPASSVPPPKIFARGQFTFNRRFFETQMPGFFAMVRPDALKDMILTVRATRGSYVAQRISRISATEVTFQLEKGDASTDVLVPFIEIQEVQIKHRDA